MSFLGVYTYFQVQTVSFKEFKSMAIGMPLPVTVLVLGLCIDLAHPDKCPSIDLRRRRPSKDRRHQVAAWGSVGLLNGLEVNFSDDLSMLGMIPLSTEKGT